MKRKNKIIVIILIFLSIFICFNLYLNYQKQITEIDKEFKNSIVLEDNKIIESKNIKITGTLSDTHFIYRYQKFSQQLKGTVSVGSEKYYISASSEMKDGTISGILTKDKDNLVSDYGVTLSKDLKQICIYKSDYIISAPAKTLDEALNIYKSIVDIPVN